MSHDTNESTRLQQLTQREALKLQQRLLEAPQAAGVIDLDDDSNQDD